MIEVKNRKMIVPVAERTLGTTGDANTETRVFNVPRVDSYGDISALGFFLDVVKPSGNVTTIAISKEILDNSVRLTTIDIDSALEEEGTVLFQLRGVDENNTVRWNSIKEPFYVEQAVIPNDIEDAGLVWALAGRVANVEAMMATIVPMWQAAMTVMENYPQYEENMLGQVVSLQAEIEELRELLNNKQDAIEIVNSSAEVTEENKLYLVKVGS